MSYDARKNQEGEILLYPLELPMYNGNNAELGRQATISLTSCLRHFAIVDAVLDDEVLVPDEDETNNSVNTHYSQGIEQLISTIMSLVSIADNYGIDIMEEINEVPWLV